MTYHINPPGKQDTATGKDYIVTSCSKAPCGIFQHYQLQLLDFSLDMPEDNATPLPTELTEREQEILRLVATGTSNKDIAQKLFISSNTVKVHLRNIFGKIGVTSRTEAAVFAIHTGLAPDASHPSESSTIKETPVSSSLPPETRKTSPLRWILLVAVVLLAGGAITYAAIRFNASPNPLPSATPLASTAKRWQDLADLPTARKGLAAAVYENRIYAIGGETSQGITGVMEQYDAATDKWTTLATKPVAVADVSAAVVGGKIYVPGGRLASGSMTNVVESYDPLTKQWEKHAVLPAAISGYSLAAYEGKLYLAGGWDGENILNTLYEYNPETDKWTKRAPMPTARAFAGAAIAGGKLYVLGGFDGAKGLTTNEEYIPDRDTWSKKKALPEARYAMGVTSIADLVYAIGGIGGTGGALRALQYSYQQDQWQELESSSAPQSWSYLGLVPLQTHLYGLGGEQDSVPSAVNLSYQAIYTISIPILP
jgi:DNA-binding CsgD family transcriptional regulator